MQQERTVPDWGVQPDGPRGGAHGVQRGIVLSMSIALALVLGSVLGPIFGFLPTLLIMLGLMVAGFWWVNNQGLLAMRPAGASRCTPDQEPRVRNIVRGLAADMRIKTPELYVIAQGGPNSIACIARGRAALGFTRTLLDTYTRTELEAVAAHGLVRLASGTIHSATLSIALGPLGRKRPPPVGEADDVQACAATRYPPALASAIEKAEPRSGRFAALWFVAHGGGHRDHTERVAAIRDL